MSEIQKVTDPSKIVTDPILLSALEKQGIDSDYVELWHDYAPRSKGKEYSPYAKFYRDLKLNKKFMVVSGLPMVDAEGQKIEVGFLYADGKYHSKKNVFSVIVDNRQIKLLCLNDQPTGVKKDNQVTFQPQLFLGGVERLPINPKPTLFDTDPQNKNYSHNVLEWDYGICKRRLRIIEGNILGSWIFAQKPSGEVRIKYNQSGDFRLKLGQFKINDDEEIIKPKDFDRLIETEGYPVIVSDTETFYPDTNAAGVDGEVRYDTGGGGNLSWATIIGLATGTHCNYTAEASGMIWIMADNTSGKWRIIRRGIHVLDTSGLPSAAIITNAVYSIYGYGRGDPQNWDFDVNVYGSTPANNTSVVIEDYDQVQTTPYCNTPIAVDNWNFDSVNPGTSNDFVFNQVGINAIQKNDVTKLGLRNANYDIAGSPPTWFSTASAFMHMWASEKGAGYKPKLVVTYYVIPRHGFVNFQDPGLI